MRAVIMAGGEGSRLRPMTTSVPKPMVKLCGRPVSEYILDLLSKYGCTEAVFTLRYHGAQIESHFDSCRYKGIALDFSYEDNPLGTAGCVKKAAEKFGEDFLVISGDAMCDFDLRAAMEYHINSGAEATIITKRVEDPREYGCVIAKAGIVTAAHCGKALLYGGDKRPCKYRDIFSLAENFGDDTGKYHVGFFKRLVPPNA